MTTNTNTSRSPKAAAILSLTAFGLLVALVLQAVSPIAPEARAEMTIKSEGFSGMTTRSSTEELFWLVDDSTETLFIYGVANNGREVEFHDRQNLRELFTAARTQAGG
ncbi:MAG: hypothetical protein AAGI53_01875 [Planctomycetota bacterium]